MTGNMVDDLSGIEEQEAPAESVVDGESWSVQSGNSLNFKGIPYLQSFPSVC